MTWGIQQTFKCAFYWCAHAGTWSLHIYSSYIVCLICANESGFLCIVNPACIIPHSNVIICLQKKVLGLCNADSWNLTCVHFLQHSEALPSLIHVGSDVRTKLPASSSSIRKQLYSISRIKKWIKIYVKFNCTCRISNRIPRITEPNVCIFTIKTTLMLFKILKLILKRKYCLNFE